MTEEVTPMEAVEIDGSKSLMKRMYDWVLHWAETPYGAWALLILAFAESSFFPIPPDVLLIALCIGMVSRSFWFAAVCSIGSILGGIFGYYIGYGLFEVVGQPILEMYGYMEKFNHVGDLYNEYAAWAVGVAGFTPIPYKVFTIAAGTFKINFFIFLGASAISRSARFFIVAALIWKFGPQIKSFIDKYFNILSIIFIVLLILGFVIVKLVV